MTLRIGIDFGGVLSIHDRSHMDGKEHRSTQIDMPYALEALKYLKSQGHQLYLISFCGRSRAIDTLASLKTSGVYELFTAVYFVKDKLYKKDLCRYLGCDVMIDDTRSILIDIYQHYPSCRTLLFESSTGWNLTLRQLSELKPSSEPDPSVNIKLKIQSV